MIANDFVTGLRHLEEERDAGPLADLYAAEGVSGNTTTSQLHTGPDGAREFWTHYRDAFESITSHFRNVVEDGDVAVLEWTSKATIDGEEISYEGVTVVESADGKITRSTAYFDPAVFTARTQTAAPRG